MFAWRKLFKDGSLSAVSAGEQVVPASDLAEAMKQIRELQRLLGTWARGDSIRLSSETPKVVAFSMRTNPSLDSPTAHEDKRFLFGSVRADGFLDVSNVTLSDEVQTAYNRDPNSVRASYRFEIVASLRGSQWQLHRRVVRENSAIQRTYDELFPKDSNGVLAASQDNSPHLFSLFLDPAKSQRQDGSVSYSFPTMRSTVFCGSSGILKGDTSSENSS